MSEDYLISPVPRREPNSTERSSLYGYGRTAWALILVPAAVILELGEKALKTADPAAAAISAAYTSSDAFRALTTRLGRKTSQFGQLPTRIRATDTTPTRGPSKSP